MVTFPNFFTTPQNDTGQDSFDTGRFGNRLSKGMSLLNRVGAAANTGMALYANAVRSEMQASQAKMRGLWGMLQADQIGINAQQTSNAIREQLLKNMSAATAMFAGKGFDVEGAELANIVSRRNAMQDIHAVQAQSRMSTIASRAAAQQQFTDARIARELGRFERGRMIGDLGRQLGNIYFQGRGLLG
jgi:hypothetical protein